MIKVFSLDYGNSNTINIALQKPAAWLLKMPKIFQLCFC